MTRFLRGAVPPARDVLLIESGSQALFQRGLEKIRRAFPDARLQLLTCWPDADVKSYSRVYRVQEYASRRDKLALLYLLRRTPPDMLGVLCSGEPIMSAWKVLALLSLPSKVLIINENGDFFWLDWPNRSALRQFLQSRWVVIRKEFLLTVLRALVFPLTVLYLLANAARLYARRWLRLLRWKWPEDRASRRGMASLW